MFEKTIDGKRIIVKSNSKNIPPFKVIKDIYSKIPDDKRVPVVFETKEQYLNEYIRNQEKAKGSKFSDAQKASYKRAELSNMSNIVSRYTTKTNPYIDRRVVFFNDHKIPVNQFKDSVVHEYGHELWEKNPKIRKDWKSVSKSTSPTPYGSTSKQEDFADSLMLHTRGKLLDSRREAIIEKDTSQNRSYSPKKINSSVAKLFKIQSGFPEDMLEHEEGKKELGHTQDENRRIIPVANWHGNIEKQTIENPNYRKVLFTGGHSQLVLMSLKPKESIGNEVHPKVDQFFRIEQGKAKFTLNNGKTKFTENNGGAAVIPAGTWHNVTNSSAKSPLKLYTVYSPANHPPGTIQRDRPSKDNVAEGLGFNVPDSMMYNENFFLHGMPKKMNPVEVQNIDKVFNIAKSEGGDPWRTNTISTYNINPVKDWKSMNSINLKNPSKFKFGSIEWQEAHEHNINEKLNRNEPLGGSERSYMETQAEIHPKKDIEWKFELRKVKKDEDSEDRKVTRDIFSHNMPFVKQTTVPAVDYPEEYNSYIEKKTVKMSPDKFLDSTREESARYQEGKGKYANARQLRNMSNEEYSGVWDSAEPYIHEGKALKETWKDQSRVDRVKKGLNEGKNIPGLFIDQDIHGNPVGHEGRHRALAAKELGITELPVHIMTERPYDKPKDGSIFGKWSTSKKATVIDTIPGEFEGKASRHDE